MIDRVAYLSVHTSPLATPGSGDAGGMNVYIHELAQTMAGAGGRVESGEMTLPHAPDALPLPNGVFACWIGAALPEAPPPDTTRTAADGRD